MITVLHNLGTILIVIVLLFDVYVAYDVWRRYKQDKINHPDEGWTEHLWDAVHDSVTILWTKFCVAISTIILFLDPIAELLGGDEAKQALNSTIGNPKIMASVILGITAITYLARMRSIWQTLGGSK